MIDGGSTKAGAARIDLAATPDFDLGRLRIRPARRQVTTDGADSRDLEPRVMKVLIALAQARPEVVSRDTLIDLCWDGRIVSDDSINRCILALRNLARQIDPPPFSIETFPRIGYGLVEHLPAGETHFSADRTSRIDRRRAVVAVAAGGLLAAAGGGYWLTRKAPVGTRDPAAADWYRKGVETREQGLFELFPQVQAHFRQAVQADPGFADGWSALALAYAGPVMYATGNDQVALSERARSAAKRALELDPDSLEARAALAFIPSQYRRWAAAQAELRRLLDEGPGSIYLEWVLRARLDFSLGECGRCREALALSRSAQALKPFHPGSWANLIYALWAAGELEEADRESERAVERWPAHAGLWLTRLAFLTYSGRPGEAVAFAARESRPPFVELEDVITRRLASARALATGDGTDVEKAVALHLDRIKTAPEDMMAATRFFSALGRIDTVFEICEAYFFNGGPFAIADRPPAGPLTRFEVIDLFWPPMAPVWHDPRFDRLTERIGLAAYWRTTGSGPDYRRSRAG